MPADRGDGTAPRVAIVAALDLARVIGRGNQLPWRLPADLKHFRRLTLDKPVVMGRKTFASIGAALPRRTNIVLSRGHGTAAGALPAGVLCARSLDEALALAAPHGDEAMVIGGEGVFAEALPRCQRMHLTIVRARVAGGGDAFFPEVESSEWAVTAREERDADADNPYACGFLTLERVRPPGALTRPIDWGE